jgi:Holliday junction resolvase RusA-like endonuclease
MNGVVFRDDAQIVELVATKLYGEIPCVQVLVEPLDDV